VQHAQPIKRELDLLDDVANSSAWRWKPCAALFYVQRAVLSELPQLTEALARPRARCRDAGAGQADAEERARLENLSDRARRSYESARRSLTLAAGRHPLPANVESAQRPSPLPMKPSNWPTAPSCADQLTMPARNGWPP
jgi:hypothetical protein